MSEHAFASAAAFLRCRSSAPAARSRNFPFVALLRKLRPRAVWFNVVYYIYRISSVEKHMTRCYRIHARRRNCFEPPRTLVGRRTRTDRDGICPPPRDSPIDPSKKSRLGGSRSWDFLISSRALYQLSYRTKLFLAFPRHWRGVKV